MSHFIERHSSEAFEQNQNYVEQGVQEAKTPITQHKWHTVLDNKYSYDDMLVHVSDVNNYCVLTSLKWQRSLKVFCGETPDLSVFRSLSIPRVV